MATPLKIRDRSSRYIEKHERGDEPYVQGIFIDVFVYDIPNNPSEILTQQFGEYLIVPPVSQQTMRHCKELIPHL